MVLRKSYQKIEVYTEKDFAANVFFLILKLVTNSVFQGRLYSLAGGEIMTEMVTCSFCLVQSDSPP